MDIYIDGELLDKKAKYSVNSVFNALASAFTISIDSSLIEIDVMKEQSVVFKSNNQVVLTGMVKSITLSTSTKADTTIISGYSTGGIIQELYPKDTECQYKEISLKEFAETLCNPYNVSVFFSPIAKKKELDEYIIKEIEFKETDKIKKILIKASRQLGLILRHDERGGVLFTYPDVNDKTVADISTIKSGRIKYSTENMYSKLTMFDDIEIGSTISSSKDTYAINADTGIDVDRTMFFKSTFSDNKVSSLEILGKRGLQYKGLALTLAMEGEDVEMIENGWINKASGVLIAGDVVSVQSDELSIKNTTRFMVLRNDISEDAKGVRSNLTLIPHEAYTNKKITKFWS